MRLAAFEHLLNRNGLSGGVDLPWIIGILAGLTERLVRRGGPRPNALQDLSRKDSALGERLDLALSGLECQNRS